jgi:hypothetical protein
MRGARQCHDAGTRAMADTAMLLSKIVFETRPFFDPLSSLVAHPVTGALGSAARREAG